MKPSEIGGSKKSRFSKYTKIKYIDAEPGSREVGHFDVDTVDTSEAGHGARVFFSEHLAFNKIHGAISGRG